VLIALACGRIARAAPGELLPVGDPLEAELRVLDVLGPDPLGGRVRLPHPGIRPLQFVEIEGTGAAPESLDRARALSLARLERALGRQAADGFQPDPRRPSTPWAWRRGGDDGQALELSLGLEGRGDTGPGRSSFATGTGAHARVGVALENLLAWSHLLVGQVERARAFADPLVPDNDLIVYTEDTYVGYTAASRRWAAWLGRSRWHWGPGEEGSLTLSKTSPAFTGLAMRVHVDALHADAIALSATLDPASQHQLAAHRIEWEPARGLRLGLTETASYRGTGWHPLYLMGAIPFILVQRLEWQDSPDSLRALRNNIMVGTDVSWRVRPGTRIYGELLLDDIHARTRRNPNKVGYQLGWDGVGTIGRTRVVWGGEYTRLSRYVYSSFFGQSYTAHGEPLGFPTGPDSRRLRLRASWDWNEDWQFGARVTHTDAGESDIDEPFVPESGAAKVNAMRFAGIVERTRQAEAGLRWWPAGGVDLVAWGGWRWIENERHLAGRTSSGPTGALEIRLIR
jgi:hypothetical protein